VKEFKGYQDETRFVIEHWAEVRQLLDAVDAARTDAAGLLNFIKARIEEREWFDSDVWHVEVVAEKSEVRIYKKAWTQGEDHALIGFEHLTLDNILGEEAKASSYAFVPARQGGVPSIWEISDNHCRVARVH